jgi:hypothetical protein
MILTEPDVTLTDLALAVECAGMALWLCWREPGRSAASKWFVLFFAAVGASALLGAISHGFLTEANAIYPAVWRATLLAIGVATFAGWAIGATLVLSKRAANGVLMLAGLSLAAYAIVIGWISHAFVVALIYYLPGAAFLLVCFAVAYGRSRKSHLLAGIAGLIVSFAAGAIQNLGIGIPSLGLTHNAVYHLVEAVAIGLMFVTAVGLSRGVTCLRDATS